MTMAYDIATATVAATLAGNEFAVAAFVHPQLRKLTDDTHAKIAAPLAAVLGRFMPFWYGLALVLALGAAFEHRPLSRGPGLLIASAATLWAATIVYTIATLVPINNRIARLNRERPYDGWLADRTRWDRHHRARVLLLLVSVLLLFAGLFQSR